MLRSAAPVTRRFVRSIGSPSPLSFFQEAAGGAARTQTLPANTVVRFVPQQTAWVVERMGRFDRILPPGLAILVPFLDRIAYVQLLKEMAVEVPSQSAITADNVTLELDGVLFLRVEDAYKALYGVENAQYAVSQLAQTTMRLEIGMLTLDEVLRGRQELNRNINAAINEAAADWGVTCLRYEIRDVHPPQDVLDAMHRQVGAERRKRAEILDSEGVRQSRINVAEGEKQAVVLESEAKRTEEVNKAEGEARAIELKAQATAEALKKIASVIETVPGGRAAAEMAVAQEYVREFGKVVGGSSTVVVPLGMGEIGGWVKAGMSILDGVKK